MTTAPRMRVTRETSLRQSLTALTVRSSMAAGEGVLIAPPSCLAMSDTPWLCRSAELDLTKWWGLFAASGKAIMVSGSPSGAETDCRSFDPPVLLQVENCHWYVSVPCCLLSAGVVCAGHICTTPLSPPALSGVTRFPMPLGVPGRITARKIPSQSFALPQRYYLVCCAALRRSGDIKPNWFSIMRNLETVFSLAERNFSTPQCWAYPDMLEARATGERACGRPRCFTTGIHPSAGWPLPAELHRVSYPFRRLGDRVFPPYPRARHGG